MATTYLSFGPGTPSVSGGPAQQYGFKVNMSLAELETELSQALASSGGLFTAMQVTDRGERPVLINAHAVRFAVEHA